jgi:pyridoxal phosphate enzyme (YggS family)
MEHVARAYKRLCDIVAQTADRAGRNHDDIRIVAVSKTVPVDVIQSAIDAGIVLFGENRVQEAAAKIPQLRGDFSFHLVGHLQSNKSKEAVRLFDLIHSIDKASTAQKVNEEAAKIRKSQKVLVQVNTSGEATKSGVVPEEAKMLCEAVLQCGNLELCGLMTIGPLTDDEHAVRQSFRMLRELRDFINQSLGIAMKELSMGMSSDFTIAIEEGATMVRVGTKIFGARA